MRQSISSLKDDLNRYYFVLYDVPKSKTIQQSKVSFTDSDIAKRSVKIISLTPARTEGVFDVVIEVCAGNNPISDPITSLSSDRKQSTLKLSKVIANTCYKTGAKMDATLQESITAIFVDSVSDTIALESTIKELVSKLGQTRTELTSLTQNTINPDPKRIHQLTEVITSLRADIVAAKSLYYQSLYKAYKTE
jgi:low affinity Fe/Cu permease